MPLIIDQKHVLWRYLDMNKVADPMIVYALNDLIKHTACEAVDMESTVDDLGSTLYLTSKGMPATSITNMVTELKDTVRNCYMTATTPEERNIGIREVTVDAEFQVHIRTGLDPYAV